MTRHSLTLTLSLFFLSSCLPAPSPPQTLRLATTTSTENSGLLNAILPGFESEFSARVEVVAVGTGQALALGRSGDADVLLVHDRAREDQFMAEGDGLERLDVMYNDFVLVGPADDPAGVRRLALAAEALARIALAEAYFVSRGDESGTHAKELALWRLAGLQPDESQSWYRAIGQGMGATLTFANETRAYTLTDRGTWLAQKVSLPGLALLVGGSSIAENLDPSLLNPYGVIVVDLERHPGVNAELAQKFAGWATSLPTQEKILEFGQAQYGQPLFYPASVEWLLAHPLSEASP